MKSVSSHIIASLIFWFLCSSVVDAWQWCIMHIVYWRKIGIGNNFQIDSIHFWLFVTGWYWKAMYQYGDSISQIVHSHHQNDI